jgi:hypothetical protein
VDRGTSGDELRRPELRKASPAGAPTASGDAASVARVMSREGRSGSAHPRIRRALGRASDRAFG